MKQAYTLFVSKHTLSHLSSSLHLFGWQFRFSVGTCVLRKQHSQSMCSFELTKNKTEETRKWWSQICNKGDVFWRPLCRFIHEYYESRKRGVEGTWDLCVQVGGEIVRMKRETQAGKRCLEVLSSSLNYALKMEPLSKPCNVEQDRRGSLQL